MRLVPVRINRWTDIFLCSDTRKVRLILLRFFGSKFVGVLQPTFKTLAYYRMEERNVLERRKGSTIGGRISDKGPQN